jgi:HK97 family phage prohead protease
VSFKDRMIDVMAAPWDEPAQVSWRGQTWREIFLRGAFDEAVNNAVRIPVNREHVYGDTVGRVVRLRNADNGLLATVKVAKTPRGDDTLQLASEGVLSPSVGWFAQKMSDVILDKRSMVRRVRRAFLEHMAMVEVPAFRSAHTVSVHDDFTPHPAAGLQPLVTPALDEWVADDVLSWASQRLGK